MLLAKWPKEICFKCSTRSVLQFFGSNILRQMKTLYYMRIHINCLNKKKKNICRSWLKISWIYFIMLFFCQVKLFLPRNPLNVIQSSNDVTALQREDDIWHYSIPECSQSVELMLWHWSYSCLAWIHVGFALKVNGSVLCPGRSNVKTVISVDDWLHTLCDLSHTRYRNR